MTARLCSAWLRCRSRSSSCCRRALTMRSVRSRTTRSVSAPRGPPGASPRLRDQKHCRRAAPERDLVENGAFACYTEARLVLGTGLDDVVVEPLSKQLVLRRTASVLLESCRVSRKTTEANPPAPSERGPIPRQAPGSSTSPHDTALSLWPAATLRSLVPCPPSLLPRRDNPCTAWTDEWPRMSATAVSMAVPQHPTHESVFLTQRT
jgi:hypothetical protein